jgi:hypothetical protein
MEPMLRHSLTVLALVLVTAFGAHTNRVIAAEGAAGFYLLGSTTTNAGILPPPGTYVINYNYFYSGSTDFTLDIAGLILDGGVDANAYFTIPAPLWVAPGKVLGGNIAFLMLVPIGWKDVEAGASLTGPRGGVIGTKLRDEETKFGDPVPGMMMGWHHGNWHFKTHTLVNVPVGFWERGNLANIGFNRWGIDNAAAFTWLDPKIGLELSAMAGFTYNFENPATDYKTGTEFHVEYAAVQNFSKHFALGVNGYYYDQVTGDSGSGAGLGSFKGRVVAIGPVMNLNFQVAKIPVSANLKYFREFDVENRLEGDAGYLTLTMPLSIAGH